MKVIPLISIILFLLLNLIQATELQEEELGKITKELEQKIKKFEMDTITDPDLQTTNLNQLTILKAQLQNNNNLIEKIQLKKDITLLDQEINSLSGDELEEKKKQKIEKETKLLKLDEEINIYKLEQDSDKTQQKLKTNVEEEEELFQQWEYFEKVKKYKNEIETYEKNHLENVKLIEKEKSMKEVIKNFDKILSKCLLERQQISKSKKEEKQNAIQNKYEENVQTLVEIKNQLEKLVEEIQGMTKISFEDNESAKETVKNQKKKTKSEEKEIEENVTETEKQDIRKEEEEEEIKEDENKEDEIMIKKEEQGIISETKQEENKKDMPLSLNKEENNTKQAEQENEFSEQEEQEKEEGILDFIKKQQEKDNAQEIKGKKSLLLLAKLKFIKVQNYGGLSYQDLLLGVVGSYFKELKELHFHRMKPLDFK